MGKMVADGLARLQTQSRISANTWREWCNLLKMDPLDAMEVWEEICYPIMIATRQMPEVTYILQTRAARPELDIYDFREEVPKFLHAVTFLYGLQDECLTKGKARSAVLNFYRKSAAAFPASGPSTDFVTRFVTEFCAVVLVAKVLKGPNITLAGVLKPLLGGKVNREQLVRLGVKSLGGAPYADAVRACLDAVDEDANEPDGAGRRRQTERTMERVGMTMAVRVVSGRATSMRTRGMQRTPRTVGMTRTMMTTAAGTVATTTKMMMMMATTRTTGATMTRTTRMRTRMLGRGQPL